MDQLTPHPGDRVIIESFRLPLVEAWIMAVYGFRDGAPDEFEPLVIVQWPGRINKTDEEVTVRMAISPEDAVGLAQVLHHSGRRMMRAEEDRVSRPVPPHGFLGC